MGYFIEPFKRHQNRQVITRSPKFYLFDTGVAGIIIKREISEEKGVFFGKAFEHFILMEIIANRFYNNKDFDITFWRTKAGAEVDFILGDAEVAIKVKGTFRVEKKDLRYILIFNKEFSPSKSIVVYNELEERLYGPIKIIPYKVFLSELWSGNIIT